MVGSENGTSEVQPRQNLQPFQKRRRVRGGGSVTVNSRSSRIDLEEEGDNEVEALEIEDNLIQIQELLDEKEDLDILPYVFVHSYSESSQSDDEVMLADVAPQWVIMLDPDVAFIRKLEIYKALNPQKEITVFFTIYDNSIQEQQYLGTIRREKEAFERLIQQNSTMVIPLDHEGNVVSEYESSNVYWDEEATHIAGGQKQSDRVMSVLVDVREFRCALPSMIHSRNMKIIPCTLEVGDYILSPDVCVERKSISDLIQSLKSGRLFTQCESMLNHYKTVLVLIEFEQTRSFRLFHSRVSEDGDVCMRLVLLCSHFPRVQLIWSSGASATADIFKDIKILNVEEPKMQTAVSIGIESEPLNQELNIVPTDVLRGLPGITFSNYRKVVNSVASIRELSDMCESVLQDLIGVENGRVLFRFFNTDLRLAVETSKIKTAKSRKS